MTPKPVNEEDPNIQKIISELDKNLKNVNEALFGLFVCLGNILNFEENVSSELKDTGFSDIVETLYTQGALLDKSWVDPFFVKLENVVLEIIF